jgi:branched-chain amino acid transport system ATP-binding protein
LTPLSIRAQSSLVILEVRNLRKAFGSVVVADELDLAVTEGEALGVIGPNGAGKTSLFNLITGTVARDGGEIVLAGRDISDAPPHVRAREGIARSFQIPLPFTNLTVFENLLVAATHGRRQPESAAWPGCRAILDDLGLLPLANRPAGSLTLLERKRLELARALATGPRVLLLDEIAGGLTESECLKLVDSIKRLRAAGVTIIWIEHVVHALLEVVGRLVVLNFGRKIADGEPKDVIATRAVREIYLGIEA